MFYIFFFHIPPELSNFQREKRRVVASDLNSNFLVGFWVFMDTGWNISGGTRKDFEGFWRIFWRYLRIFWDNWGLFGDFLGIFWNNWDIWEFFGIFLWIFGDYFGIIEDFSGFFWGIFWIWKNIRGNVNADTAKHWPLEANILKLPNWIGLSTRRNN